MALVGKWKSVGYETHVIETFDFASAKRRSFICRPRSLVPSLPASGDVFGPNIIESVGGSIGIEYLLDKKIVSTDERRVARPDGRRTDEDHRLLGWHCWSPGLKHRQWCVAYNGSVVPGVQRVSPTSAFVSPHMVRMSPPAPTSRGTRSRPFLVRGGTPKAEQS